MKRSLLNFVILAFVWYVFGRLSAHGLEYQQSTDINPITYFSLRALPLLSVGLFVLLLQVKDLVDLIVALIMWPTRWLLGKKQKEAPDEEERYNNRKHKTALVITIMGLYAVVGIVLSYLEEGISLLLPYTVIGMLWSLVVLLLLYWSVLNLQEMIEE